MYIGQRINCYLRFGSRTDFTMQMEVKMQVYLIGILTILTAACSSVAQIVQNDCAGSKCPEIKIVGDKEATLPNGDPSPFRGFADATIRRDPDSGRLWMAYSWPNVHVDDDKKTGLLSRRPATSPRVDIHLAYSDDQGRKWQFAKTLWSPTNTRGPGGQQGHMSHEVANLLPVREGDRVSWYGARLDYFLPDDGGFAKRPPESFRILVGRASSPGELTDAPTVALGSMKTDAAWGMNVNLAKLSAETSHCMLWNEPALFHDGDELFLALSCMAFRGKTPDMEKNDLVVFAARTEGVPTSWKWRYAGKLAGSKDAKELGGERLTQIDLAKNKEGRLMAIITPDTWDNKASDFVHRGCVAVEVDTSNKALKLARGSNGLKVLTRINASDAGPSGTAACTYDPSSITGIILGKRNKISVGLGQASDRTKAQMFGELHATGVHP